MNPPDWANCTEEMLWYFVAWHLEGAGISSVLVGGAVVAIYSEGMYRSGDLDLVADVPSRRELERVLHSIGFEKSKSRYFKHPQCPHLFIEFPKGPVEIGEQFPVIPDEVIVQGRSLKILSPTDSVKDRLAGYIHWRNRSYFDQAALLCRRQQHRVDLESVRAWCDAEGGRQAFSELIEHLRQAEHP